MLFHTLLLYLLELKKKLQHEPRENICFLTADTT